METKQLQEQYAKYAERYGTDAPVAMLRWLRLAQHSEDDVAQRLAAVIGEMLAKRCVAIFEATHQLGIEEQSSIEAYENAHLHVQQVLNKANMIGIFAPDE